MKKLLTTIAISLAFATTAVRADLANYQSTVTGQSPTYDFHFDNSLVDSVGGTATFTANVGATFGSDYSGNANDAVSFPSATTGYLSLASPVVISGEGTATAIGSMSMLFYLPNTVPGTGYLFSDSETSASEFAFDESGGAFQLKVGNKTIALTGAPTPTANTWYYLGLTYNLSGTAVGVNGVNWYLGAAGGTLTSGFYQKGTIGGTTYISTTATLGDGGTFILGNRRAFNNTFGVGSELDELATWSTALDSSVISAQFNALTTTVPEPSTCAVLGLSGLLLFARRTFRHDLPGK
jgi:hypothetical protein